MFFKREQYTTPVYEMQGCAALLRRKRQKTGRSELLPVMFVQFLLSAVLQRGQVGVEATLGLERGAVHVAGVDLIIAGQRRDLCQ